MSRPSGWRSQSLEAHRHLTGAGSKADSSGLFPAYARLALLIAISGAKIAGMAKKRWRDDDAGRMKLARVRRLRAEIDGAFEKLEDELQRKDGGTRQAVRNRERADAVFARYGRLGYLALAVIEESGELAEPLRDVADGSKAVEEARQDIDDESADVRTYLHVVSESMGIDPTATTESKWARSRERLPELFGPGVRRVDAPRKDMKALMTPGLFSGKRKS